MSGNTPSQNTPLADQIEALQPWRQKVRVDGVDTPGVWDVKQQADFIRKNAPWPLSGRLLDCGANAGGLSIELQSDFDSVLAIETGGKYSEQFAWLKTKLDASKVEYKRETLFHAHQFGHFDVALMLGLFYHFRHPALFLDYCSNLDCDKFVFSTQVTGGDLPVMWNRVGHAVFKGEVRGWQPQRALFANMLRCSGFRVENSLDSPPGFGNKHYVFCTRERAIKTDVEAIVTLSKREGFWC